MHIEQPCPQTEESMFYRFYQNFDAALYLHMTTQKVTGKDS